MTIDQTTIDQMTIDQKTIDQKTIDRTTNDSLVFRCENETHVFQTCNFYFVSSRLLLKRDATNLGSGSKARAWTIGSDTVKAWK